MSDNINHEIGEVTVFANIEQINTPFYRSLEFVLDRIKNGGDRSKDLVVAIRKEKSKDVRNKLKKGLPSICFSGKFKKRYDSQLEAHSGLICLDLDGIPSTDLMNNIKEVLSKSRYVTAVFISPSNAGLKVLVKIPLDPENQKLYFNGLKHHFIEYVEYWDDSVSNLSRVCYESYDPEIYVNLDADVWVKKLEPIEETKEISTHKITYPLKEEGEIIRKLLKWWTVNHPFVEGQRNNSLFILVDSMNRLGIDQNVALSHCLAYDLPNDEIEKVVMRTYSRNRDKFGTEVFENTEKVDDLKSRINNGVPVPEIRKELEKDGVLESEEIDSLIIKLKDGDLNIKFWKVSDRGAISVDHMEFRRFLEANGFYKYSQGDGVSFIRVKNNLLSSVVAVTIKDFVLDHLETINENRVWSHFAGHPKYFKDDYLSMIQTLELNLNMDTDSYSFMYFRNCAVKISVSDVVPIDYIDLGAFVWEKHIIKRDYDVAYKGRGKESMFAQFIQNVAGEKGLDKTPKTETIRSTIGFLLHGYKPPAFCPAVILNDAIISSNPEGGTGKGLIMKAIGKLRRVVTIDGKNFQQDSAFSYQNIDLDTQIVTFDDIKRGFSFERLFSVITEGVTVEKKRMQSFTIPFDRSPKIALTTNYALRGGGNSHERRKWEIELHKYYSKNFTPETEFKMPFFSGWDDHHWSLFDNFMIESLQMYLEEGFIAYDFDNVKIKKLTANTSEDFVEWLGLINSLDTDFRNPVPRGMELNLSNLRQDFIAEFPSTRNNRGEIISSRFFNFWMNHYIQFLTGESMVKIRRNNGYCINIPTKEEMAEETQRKLSI